MCGLYKNMIEWKDLKLPALNLWNYPKQPDIKHHIKAIEWNEYLIKQDKEYIGLSKLKIDIHKQMIKDKNFIYYLRSGRFIDD